MLHTKIQPKILYQVVLEKKLISLVLLFIIREAIFLSSTRLNFIILKPCSLVMLHVVGINHVNVARLDVNFKRSLSPYFFFLLLFFFFFFFHF